MHFQMAELVEYGKDYMQIAIPVALALLTYRQKVIEDSLKEIKKLLFDHIIPKPK